MFDSNLKLIAVDFDGVIVDSTEECLVTAWNGYQIFTDTGHFISAPSDTPASYRRHFRSIRNYVRTMDEFFAVFQSAPGEINSQSDFDRKISTLRDVERKRFGRCFLDARNTYKKKDKKAWLNLHTVYAHIQPILEALQKRYKFYIVTGKDKASVRDFFESFIIDVPAQYIYDPSRAKSKLAALDEIRKKEGLKPEEMCLLDDNVTHLLGPHSAGYKVLLAAWGYGLPEHFETARKNNITIISLSEIHRCAGTR